MSQRDPQRDFGGEFVVALVALAVLVFAAVFGILLTLWARGNSDEMGASPTTAVVVLHETISVTFDQPDQTQPDTLTPDKPGTDAADAVDPTDTESAVHTPRVVTSPPSDETDPPAPSETTVPTRRRTATPTDAPTHTDTATDTLTPTETSSRTPKPTSTNTPTDTPTDTPTEIFTETETPSITPSDTAAPTETTVPTETASATDTGRPPLRDTAAPTADATIPALPTLETVRPCTKPDGWVLYTARFGETFDLLSTAVDTPVERLLTANCRPEGRDDLLAGDGVYLPEMPRSTRPPERETLIGCVAPDAAFFDDIEPNSLLEGEVRLEGSANAVNFWYAKIEIRSADASQYQFVTRVRRPVEHDLLAEIDSADFEPGDYWLRLVVYNLRSQIPLTGVCVAPVTIRAPSPDSR